MGDGVNLVNNYKVKNVVFNCGEYNDLEKWLIKVLDKNKILCMHYININKLYFLNWRLFIRNLV